MLKSYPGFINGTGALASVDVNAERTVNLYPEVIDTGTGKNGVKAWLRATPGLEVFATIGGGPVRSLFYQDGRAFAVSGNRFVELFNDGSWIERGVVLDDNRPASLATNGAIGRQLVIASGMGGWVFTLDTNAFTRITSAGFPGGCLSALFADAYFIALHNGAPRFSFSSLADGLTWSSIDVAQKSQSSDNVLAMVYDHKELWLKGSKKTEIWFNSGDARNPWTPQPVLIEGGLAAADSVAQGDSSIFWLAGGEKGARTVVRADGYNPTPISTQAVASALASYARVDDALGYFYEDEGHGFYVLTFPSAGATWVYDVTTQAWHERLYWNTATAAYEAHLGRCHAFAFNKHLVGSRRDGIVYRLRRDVYTDAGAPVRRVRRAPHVTANGAEVFFHRLELEMQTGVGTLTGQGVSPLIELRYSDDSGKTWGNELEASLGAQGRSATRVYWDCLGSGRDRVHEVVITDPVFIGISDAYLDASVGVH